MYEHVHETKSVQALRQNEGFCMDTEFSPSIHGLEVSTIGCDQGELAANSLLERKPIEILQEDAGRMSFLCRCVRLNLDTLWLRHPTDPQMCPVKFGVAVVDV